MAKRRKFNFMKKAGRVARRAFSRKATRRRSSSGSTVSPLMRLVYGAGYGFARQQASNWVNANIASRLPFLGQYADEVVFGGASYLLTKSSNKTLKAIGNSGLVVEGALMGSQLGQKIQLLPNSSAVTATTNSNLFNR
jgi:hypothetical protein